MTTITRRGRLPLVIPDDAVVLAAEDTRFNNHSNRWHEITAYSIPGGFAVAVEYRTLWQGEECSSDAESFATLDEMAIWLADYDPAADVAGFPPLPHYETRQRNLKEAVARRFSNAVGRLLAKVTTAA